MQAASHYTSVCPASGMTPLRAFACEPGVTEGIRRRRKLNRTNSIFVSARAPRGMQTTKSATRSNYITVRKHFVTRARSTESARVLEYSRVNPVLVSSITLYFRNPPIVQGSLRSRLAPSFQPVYLRRLYSFSGLRTSRVTSPFNFSSTLNSLLGHLESARQLRLCAATTQRERE